MQQILPTGTDLKGKLGGAKDNSNKDVAGAGFADELGRLGKKHDVDSDELAARKTAIVAATGKALDDDEAGAVNRDAEEWLALIEEARGGEVEAVEKLQEALQSIEGDGGLTELVEKMKSQLDGVMKELQALTDSQAKELSEALQLMELHADKVDQDGTATVDFEPLQNVLQKQLEVLDALASEVAADEESLVQAMPLGADELMASLKELGIEVSDDVAGEESLRSLLAELTALLEDTENAELVAVDGAALREKLSKLLENLEFQGQPLTGGEKRDVLTLLQTQLESMEASDDAATNSQQEAIQRMLSQLNNVLESEQGEIRLAQPEQRGGNVLPPVLQALAKATEQLRHEAQAGATAAAAEGASDEDSQLAAEGLRRLFNELSGSQATAENKASSSQNGLVASNTQLTGASARDGAAVSAQARNAQETMTQTPQENARQLQQALDIMGPQAPQQLRERISVMFNSRTQAAEIRLDPPDLGRMQIRVNLNQEQASVNFQVSSPQAREALEQSMPRLRELLAENGIQLADSNVSEQKSGGDGSTGAGGDGDGFTAGNSADEVEAELAEQTVVEVPTQSTDGRIDYYA